MRRLCFGRSGGLTGGQAALVEVAHPAEAGATIGAASLWGGRQRALRLQEPCERDRGRI